MQQAELTALAERLEQAAGMRSAPEFSMFAADLRSAARVVRAMRKAEQLMAEYERCKQIEDLGPFLGIGSGYSWTLLRLIEQAHEPAAVKP